MPVDRFSVPPPASLPVSSLAPVLDLVLDWYDSNARELPWRQPPGSAALPDPYRIWLAEIMAQQTRAATAARYWKRFVGRWPTVAALAAAADDEILCEWAGLGYYARARNLIDTARIVARRGSFPAGTQALRELPGIGPYTAAAIAAIAFGEPVVAVDTNVARVVARLLTITAPLPAAMADIRARLAGFAPRRAGDFTQALMDLGATICTPRQPDCTACPLQDHCAARLAGEVDRYPARTAKTERPERQGLAWWIEHDGEVALVRRPRHGLLGGMPGLPGTPWSAESSERLPFAAQWEMQPFAIRHPFTHFELTLRVVATHAASRPATVDGQQLFWVRRAALAGVGLPGLYRRLVERMLAERMLAGRMTADG